MGNLVKFRLKHGVQLVVRLNLLRLDKSIKPQYFMVSCVVSVAKAGGLAVFTMEQVSEAFGQTILRTTPKQYFLAGAFGLKISLKRQRGVNRASGICLIACLSLSILVEAMSNAALITLRGDRRSMGFF